MHVCMYTYIHCVYTYMHTYTHILTHTHNIFVCSGALATITGVIVLAMPTTVIGTNFSDIYDVYYAQKEQNQSKLKDIIRRRVRIYVCMYVCMYTTHRRSRISQN
jgi:hypothetical protein